MKKAIVVTECFAYLRVSGKGQMRGDGFPRQMAAIKAHAAAHGLSIVRVFQEGGVSGTIESMDRPAWAEMMTALHSNGVKTILVEQLDRLARRLMVQEAAIADLQKHGFTLISVCEPDLMASDPYRVFMRQVLGAKSQLEKSQLVAKLRGARMRKKAATGRCEGRKPFGTKLAEHEALERMRELRAAGNSFDAIAASLNAEGMITRSGGQWIGATVCNILQREKRTLNRLPASTVARIASRA